ncbi:hypothetical protein [Isoptericola variabilis]|uniref:Protein kinase domain-containing protein n=1 Tax=Isoptericola variabilis (strain 225) TaxID=743718 RepID=F6FWP6_ISOV2|nr:hypothetical protein [Isoptericola variabilis]AEG45687.1 hypothetical protein Isova_3009 [Isoptericola variabilis 225]TWH33762.1 hypothetical protein L600_001600000310 [Isoptericola variabilis J7]
MTTAQPGTVVVDRYRLDRPAATDLAAAEAWEAHDQILDRPVRVTFAAGPNAPAALDAARRAALVADPRLSRVLDVGSLDLGTGPQAYVITEPYTGSSLTEIVSGGLVDPQQARAVVGEAAAALETARRRGVHHLVLRPEAVRVDGHRVVVTGLGLDAGLAGVEMSGDDAAAADARALVALAYYALTARWPGESLDQPWIAPDAVRPLPAQTDASGVVPVSTLVPHVDAELDALVRRTFAGDGSEAPSTPAEVVDALEPWGEVSVVAALPGFVQPPAEQPVRSSVLGTQAPGMSRPGTPPPAPPVRRPHSGRIARAAAVGAGGGYAAGQVQAPGAPGAPVPPAPAGDPAATQAYGHPHGAGPVPTAYAAGAGAYPPAAYAAPPVTGPQPAAPPQGPGTHPETGGFATTPVPRRKGVNPTPIVLGLVIVGVIAGALWAVGQALAPFEPAIETNPTPTVAAEPTGEAEQAEGEGSPTPEETEEPVRPVIESGDQLDPLVDGDGEHPEAVELAYDADPSTFWYTRTYRNNPVWGGFKTGAGYVVNLREPAPVTTIQLNTNSTGGRWEIRATTAEDPQGGTLLGEGQFSEVTELKLEQPEVLTSFVIWITELPQSQGEYRLELNEIVVS